ncbi:homeobox protein MSX-1 [Striga asiatica]|uniref:Homeobox protein MSX-1 n=1 Tax=Striga asiatica TaxID=4170 RepID=A0A5A7PAI7_STRAF|nr:homeobox protein MSX-1 [Striga asiatica]
MFNLGRQILVHQVFMLLHRPKPCNQILQRNRKQSVNIFTRNINPPIQTLSRINKHQIHQTPIHLPALLHRGFLLQLLGYPRHSARLVQPEAVQRARIITHFEMGDFCELPTSEVVEVEKLGDTSSEARVSGYHTLHFFTVASEYHDYVAFVHVGHHLLKSLLPVILVTFALVCAPVWPMVSEEGHVRGFSLANLDGEASTFFVDQHLLGPTPELQW